MRFRIGGIIVLSVLLAVTNARGQSASVAARTDQNLLVCSWNIKWFKDTGRDLAKIAKVLAKFDLCGIVELQSDRVLEDLQIALEQETGEKWTYIQSNRTGHSTQYIEQFAFIWRDSKVRIASGHVGNLADFQQIFRHQPYIASFRAGNFDFRFLLIHTRWTPPANRKEEVEEIARAFVFFRGVGAERDIILAGDFNYSHQASQMSPIKSLGSHIVNLIPNGTKTTLKSQDEGFSSWYDHIYVESTATTEATGIGNAYDFVQGLGYSNTQQARSEISDHLPVWAEFRIDGPDDD